MKSKIDSYRNYNQKKRTLFRDFHQGVVLAGFDQLDYEEFMKSGTSSFPKGEKVLMICFMKVLLNKYSFLKVGSSNTGFQTQKHYNTSW